MFRWPLTRSGFVSMVAVGCAHFCVFVVTADERPVPALVNERNSQCCEGSEAGHCSRCWRSRSSSWGCPAPAPRPTDHVEHHRHPQRLLLLVLEGDKRRHDDAGRRRPVQRPAGTRPPEHRRRQGLEPRLQPHRELLGHLQPQRQRLPVAVRLDHQPADRVLHRRELRQLQPQHAAPPGSAR